MKLPGIAAFVLASFLVSQPVVYAQANDQSTKDQQEQLKKDEKANKEKAKAARDQRKALRQQDKAEEATEKANPPQN